MTFKLKQTFFLFPKVIQRKNSVNSIFYYELIICLKSAEPDCSKQSINEANIGALCYGEELKLEESVCLCVE